MLLAADVQKGVAKRLSGVTEFPPLMVIATIVQTDLKEEPNSYAETMGAITAQEAVAIGWNWYWLQW